MQTERLTIALTDGRTVEVLDRECAAEKRQ